jgi:hypothetical protein
MSADPFVEGDLESRCELLGRREQRFLYVTILVILSMLVNILSNTCATIVLIKRY